MASLSTRSVNVIMLGRMGFLPAFDIQSRYAKQHLDEKAGKPNAHGEDTLLLVEHDPVYTVGIRNRNYTKDDEARLKASGAQFLQTNRGGLITFHGPGQLVAYPILNLTRYKPSMRWYVCQLEKTLVETLKPFGLTGRLTDQTGVWVEDKKIASIGLHGSRYVTTHGVALNCNSDLSWFKAIEPCGLKGVEMTSLSQELKTNVPLEEAAKPFLRAFQEVFDCDLEYRMLEKKDMNTLYDNGHFHSSKTAGQESPAPTNPDTVTSSTPDSPAANSGGDGGGGGVAAAPRMDQRVEVGIRHMSTMALSSSSSSSPSSSSSTPSSSSSSSSHTVRSSPSSSSTSSSSTDDHGSSSISDQKAVAMTIPPAIRRIGPMW